MDGAAIGYHRFGPSGFQTHAVSFCFFTPQKAPERGIGAMQGHKSYAGANGSIANVAEKLDGLFFQLLHAKLHNRSHSIARDIALFYICCVILRHLS